jgi:hypothetical protein
MKRLMLAAMLSVLPIHAWADATGHYFVVVVYEDSYYESFKDPGADHLVTADEIAAFVSGRMNEQACGNLSNEINSHGGMTACFYDPK